MATMATRPTRVSLLAITGLAISITAFSQAWADWAIAMVGVVIASVVLAAVDIWVEAVEDMSAEITEGTSGDQRCS
jgi:hypothetical protein